MLEITELMTWDEMMKYVEMVVEKLKEEEEEDRGVGKVSNSGIRLEIDESRKDGKGNGGGEKKKMGYTVRVIKNDHHYENYCFFCKN